MKKRLTVILILAAMLLSCLVPLFGAGAENATVKLTTGNLKYFKGHAAQISAAQAKQIAEGTPNTPVLVTVLVGNGKFRLFSSLGIPGSSYTDNGEKSITWDEVEKELKNNKYPIYMVYNMPTGISIQESNLTVLPQGTVTPTYTITPSGVVNWVSWSSSDTSVATVNASTGVVTGVSYGTAVITCATQDGSGLKATCSVLVMSEKAANVYALINAIPGTIDYTDACESAVTAALKAFNELTKEEQQSIPSASREKLAHANSQLEALKLYVSDCEERIDKISDPVTLEDEGKIMSARDAYDSQVMTAAMKAHVTNYAKLTAAEDKLAALKTEALISAIGEATLEKDQQITEARAAYNALSETRKALVTNLDVLVTAEDKLAALKVEALIGAIGEATPDKQEQVTAARKAYDALTENGKAFVTSLDVLVAAEDKLAAIAVAGMIEEIGVVTLEKKEQVTAVRAAYDALSDGSKALLTEEYAILTGCETELARLVKEDEDRKAAQAVTDLIKGIGSVEATDACGKKITDARAAYEKLSDDQKSLVNSLTLKKLTDAEVNYAVARVNAIGTIDTTNECNARITAAENAYKALSKGAAFPADKKTQLDNARQEYTDRVIAEEIDGKIDAIGDNVTLDSEEAITEARAAYDAGSEAQQGYVTKLNALTAAEETLKNLKSAAAEAKKVSDLIDAIQPLELSDACNARIVAAEEACSALSKEAEAFLPGEKRDEMVNARKDYDAIKATAGVIDKIGEVEYTEACKTRIDKANEEYSLLNDRQMKAFPDDKLKVLTDAAAMYSHVQAADKAIGAIPDPVTRAEACKNAIDAAASAYDGLTKAEKKLLPAEAAAKLTGAQNQYAALGADELINAIPDPVQLDDASKKAIEAARKAYDALTADQQALVTGFEKLTAAEKEYKALEDQAAADTATAAINAIPDPVQLDEKSEAAIEAARKAYDGLTKAQKKLIPAETLRKLTAAEEEYKVLADKAAADKVTKLINKIGEVLYPDSGEAILKAGKAYDKLTDDQKAYVNAVTLETLMAAEAEYKKQEDESAVSNAEALIEAIGEVEYNADCKARIEAARKDYDALTAEQKKLLGADVLKVLTDAEAEYAAMDAQAKKAPTNITLNYTKKTIKKIGGTLQLLYGVYPKDADPEVIWKSSDTKIAKVTQKGKVTALRPGTVKITVTAKNNPNVKATCKITVAGKLIKSVKFSKTSVTLHKGESKKITATIKPADAAILKLKWTSSNPKVATVTGSGKITAVKKGSCTITVKTTDGSNLKYKITVKVK